MIMKVSYILIIPVLMKEVFIFLQIYHVEVVEVQNGK